MRKTKALLTVLLLMGAIFLGGCPGPQSPDTTNMPEPAIYVGDETISVQKEAKFRLTDKIRFDNGLPGVSYYYEFGEGDIAAPTTDSKVGDFDAKDIVFNGDEFVGAHEKKYTLSVIAHTSGAKSNVKTVDLTYDGSVSIRNLKASDGSDLLPKKGNDPITEINTDEFTGTVEWKTNDGKDVNSFYTSETIEGYVATISLTAKPGYTFEDVNEGFFTVFGATTTTTPGQGMVVAKFTKPTIIDKKAILGVVKPAANGTPTVVSSITGGGAQWDAVSIVWKPNESPFIAGKVYTATITLEENVGYTFTGIGANWFTVADGTVTNATGSGIVTVEFTAAQ